MKSLHMILGLTITFLGKLIWALEQQNIGTFNNLGSSFSKENIIATLDQSQLNSLLASSQSDSGYESNIDVTALAASSFNGYGQDMNSGSDHVQIVECVLPNYFLCSNGNCLPESLFCDGENDCGDGSDEDTKVCGSISCNVTTEFKCGGGRCISNEGRCDRNFQCRDRSDESECQYESCPVDKFACADNSQCLDMIEVCDGKIDCKDGLASDELHPNPCPSNVTCPSFSFKCTTTNICASPNWMCDGENDCGDGSDELQENCKNFQCPDGWFRCSDHRCIPINQVCNGVIDCKDELASDERHPEPCPRNVTCPDDFFSCDETNICAHPHWLCDGADDCGDKSDENVERCAAVPCPEDWFRCKSQRCIPPNWRCDGTADCPTGEDEEKCETFYYKHSIDEFKSNLKNSKNDSSKLTNSSQNNETSINFDSSKIRQNNKNPKESSVVSNKAPLGSLASLFERPKSNS